MNRARSLALWIFLVHLLFEPKLDVIDPLLSESVIFERASYQFSYIRKSRMDMDAFIDSVRSNFTPTIRWLSSKEMNDIAEHRRRVREYEGEWHRQYQGVFVPRSGKES